VHSTAQHGVLKTARIEPTRLCVRTQCAKGNSEKVEQAASCNCALPRPLKTDRPHLRARLRGTCQRPARLQTTR
jgi:hypothetical protein